MSKRYFDASILERDSNILNTASAETLSFDRFVEATSSGNDTVVLLNVDGMDVRRLVVDDDIDTLLAKLPADEVFKATVLAVNGQDQTDTSRLLRISRIYGMKASGGDTIIIYGGDKAAPTEYLVDQTIAAIKALLDAYTESFNKVQVENGTAAAPTYTFTNDGDTGFYRVGANSLGVSIGGTLRATFNTTDITSTVPVLGPAGAAATPTYSFSGDLDSGMYSAGGDQLGFAVNGALAVLIGTGNTQFVTPIVASAGVAGTPSVTFAGDLNTGLYSVGADQLGVATNGVLRVTFKNGSVSSSVPFLAPDGAFGAPAYSFGTDAQTGMYLSGAGTIGFGVLGSLVFSIGSQISSNVVNLGPDGAVGTPTYSFTNDSNTGLYSVGADQLGVAVGGALKGTWYANGLKLVLPTYADNAAATGGGLAVTALYQTATGEVRIRV